MISDYYCYLYTWYKHSKSMGYPTHGKFSKLLTQVRELRGYDKELCFSIVRCSDNRTMVQSKERKIYDEWA